MDIEVDEDLLEGSKQDDSRQQQQLADLRAQLAQALKAPVFQVGAGRSYTSTGRIADKTFGTCAWHHC
jgi:hypothetical protein